MIDPGELESKIIIEAIPQNDRTPFELYTRKISLELGEDSTESHEHHSTLPIWMIPKEEIKDKADQYVIYYGEGQSFEDISTDIQNENSDTQTVLLIYITSEKVGEKIELVITSSNM